MSDDRGEMMFSKGDVSKVFSLSLDNFREVRRLFPVLAAILFLIAPLFPVWGINLHAVQYPNEVLEIHLYAYPHISGDVVEIHRLNKYIGFFYPDPVYWNPNFPVDEKSIDVPEWSFGPIAFVLPALAGLFVAVAPTDNKLVLGLKAQVVGTFLVFFGMLADVQYRLYQAGHTLDPNAPVVGVDEFTPPLIGKYEVANITSYSHLEIGSVLAILALLLLVVSYYYRNKNIKIYELIVSIKNKIVGIKNKIG